MTVSGRTRLRMSILNQLKEDLKVIFLTETKCKIRFIYLGFKAGQLECAMMCDNEICLLFTGQLPEW